MKAGLSVSHAPVWTALPIVIPQQNTFQEEDTVYVAFFIFFRWHIRRKLYKEL